MAPRSRLLQAVISFNTKFQGLKKKLLKVRKVLNTNKMATYLLIL